jgi:hypothetical protein
VPHVYRVFFFFTVDDDAQLVRATHVRRGSK